MSVQIKDVQYKGKTFRFHNSNGQSFTLFWSDGWELVAEAAIHFGWRTKHHGKDTYGHVSYYLP